MTYTTSLEGGRASAEHLPLRGCREHSERQPSTATWSRAREPPSREKRRASGRASPILLICFNENQVDHCFVPRIEPYERFNRKGFFPWPPRNVLIFFIDPVSGGTRFKDFSKHFEAYKLVKTAIFPRLEKVSTSMAAIYCSSQRTHSDSFVLRKFVFVLAKSQNVVFFSCVKVLNYFGFTGKANVALKWTNISMNRFV